MPVRMWCAKNHQCGLRSSAISSPSFSSRRGYAMVRIVRALEVVGVEVLRDEEAFRALRERELRDESIERRTMMRFDEVRELVHEHVVEDPRRVGGEASRYADRTGLGRARTPT